MPRSEKLEILKNTALALMEETDPAFHLVQPKFPFVLVYTLPRDIITRGGIWLPGKEKDQNKVVLEGIVMKTWVAPPETPPSNLKPGDHVLFPHYAGWPMSRQSDHIFRHVMEFSVSPYGLRQAADVIATIEYDREVNIEDEIHQMLKKEFAKYSEYAIDANASKSGSAIPLENFILKELMQNYVIVSKKEGSRTISGE